MIHRFFRTNQILLIGAILASCVALMATLRHDPFLRGADAYYYALQIDWWARTGAVRIADSSWIFPLLGLIQRFGFDTETLLRALLVLCLSAAALAVRYGDRGGTSAQRNAAALWFVLSPVALFTGIEFPKMFLVIVLLPLWSFQRRRWPMIISIASMLLAIGAHRSGLLFVLLFALGCLLENLTKKIRWRKAIAIGLMACAALTFVANPGILILMLRDSLPMAVKLELLITAVAYPFLAFRNQTPFRYLLPGLLAFAPLGGEEVFSTGERLALFLPLLTLLAWSRSGEEEQEMRPAHTVLFVVGFIAALLPQKRLDLSHPLTLDPNNAELKLMTNSLKSMEIPMLIARKDAAYYYKYTTLKEAFPYEPEDHWDKRRIQRLVYGIEPAELWSYLTEECRDTMTSEGRNSLLLREDCWVTARKSIDPELDSDLYRRVWAHAWNPSRKRPASLYPKHKNDRPDDFPALPPQSN